LKRVRALVALALAVAALAVFGFPGTGESDPKRKKPGRTPKPTVASVWSGGAACAELLAGGKAPRAPGVARIGAWNLHWFPDGSPGERAADEATDLDWMSCAIAWLRVDVLAISEIKHGERAAAALEQLRTKLSSLTGGRWLVVLDDCPRGASQHVGLLYDERRARLGKTETLGMLNPHGTPCKDQLRPGLAGTFKFTGGLDLAVVATHLKSGSERRAIELRSRSFEAFGAAAAAAQALADGDRDVLVIGDMNSMGCEKCSPKIAAVEELGTIDRALAAGKPALRRLDAAPHCSHHYSGKATLLDWAAASDLTELPAGRALAVSGYCAELACSGREPPRELRRLSDHCPIYVDITDVDRDDEPR